MQNHEERCPRKSSSLPRGGRRLSPRQGLLECLSSGILGLHGGVPPELCLLFVLLLT